MLLLDKITPINHYVVNGCFGISMDTLIQPINYRVESYDFEKLN